MGYQTTYCSVCGLEPTINGGDYIEKCLPIEHIRYKWLNKMIAIDKDGKKSGLLQHYGDGSTYETLDKSKIFDVECEILEEFSTNYMNKYKNRHSGILMHQNCYILAKEYFKDHIKKKNINLYTIFRPVFQMGLSLWNDQSDMSDICNTKYSFTAKQINQIYGKISKYWEQGAEYITYEQDEYEEPKIIGIDLWYFSDPLLNYNDSQKNKERILGILTRLDHTSLVKMNNPKSQKLSSKKIISNKKLIGNNKIRPSPSESATLYNIGDKKIGNDNNIYTIRVDKNGIKKMGKN